MLAISSRGAGQLSQVSSPQLHTHSYIHTLTHIHLAQALLAWGKETAWRLKGPWHPSVWGQEPSALCFSLLLLLLAPFRALELRQ